MPTQPTLRIHVESFQHSRGGRTMKKRILVSFAVLFLTTLLTIPGQAAEPAPAISGNIFEPLNPANACRSSGNPTPLAEAPWLTPISDQIGRALYPTCRYCHWLLVGCPVKKNACWSWAYYCDWGPNLQCIAKRYKVYYDCNVCEYQHTCYEKTCDDINYSSP